MALDGRWIRQRAQSSFNKPANDRYDYTGDDVLD
jgi:hypothetical protein